MTDLTTLKQTISKMSVEALQQQVMEIRASRRNFPQKTEAKKQADTTKKAIGKATLDELKALLGSLGETE